MADSENLQLSMGEKHDLDITVAICTYNRAALLDETLESMQCIAYPEDKWELLVIDNNSSDDTKKVTESYKGKCVEPRWVFEEQQGLDKARNRAIKEASGRILVLADDDILVSESWLNDLIEPFSRKEEVACVGGSVYPVFPEGIPKWMERDWTNPLMLTEKIGPIPDNSDPMGANLAFRMSVFDAVGPFLSGLDRRGNSLLCGGDAEMVRRVRKNGFEAWFAPDASVKHQFPRSRMNFKYALRHGYDSARSKVMDMRSSETLNSSELKQWLIGRFFGNLLKLPLTVIIAILLFWNPGEAKRTLVRSARSLGYIKEILFKG